MSPPLDPERLHEAVADRRWTEFVRSDVDLHEAVTWDPTIDRRTRLLIPIDVQAYVVAEGDDEPLVALTGDGRDRAHPPFAAGVPLPFGVHLHWAMPDALLRGGQDPATSPSGKGELAMPRLPDRWVVVRAVMPVGARQAMLRGWLIDATTGSITDLVPSDPSGDLPAPIDALDRLDGAFGGSLLWTASATASAQRFAFHDRLHDIEAMPNLDGNQAVYVVAGWWSDTLSDPLSTARGPSQLHTVLDSLGWWDGGAEATTAHRRSARTLANRRAARGLESIAKTVSVEIVSEDEHANRSLTSDVAIRAGVPVDRVERVLIGPRPPSYATLLHGAVMGVPVRGSRPAGVDDRPDEDAMSVALGADTDDLLSAFAAEALGVGEDNRAAAEQLCAAFTSDLLDRLGTVDGLADLAEREHSEGFWPLAGTPLPGARPDRLRAADSAPMTPVSVGRKGRGARAGRGPRNDLGVGVEQVDLAVRLRWKGDLDLVESSTGAFSRSAVVSEAINSTGTRSGFGVSASAASGAAGASAASAPGTADVREVVRPAPRWFRPQAPMLAVKGARPNHRHHGDGLFDDSNRLRCRYPNECVERWEGVVNGADVVTSLRSAAVPDETLALVREAVLLNPYSHRWLAAAGAAASNPGLAAAFEARLGAEMVRLYGDDGRYDTTSHLQAPVVQPIRTVRAASGTPTAGAWSGVSALETLMDRQVAALLAEHSLLPGTPPSPIAITTWRQPWIPLWAEWEVTLVGRDDLSGWTLGDADFERVPEADIVSSDPRRMRSFTFVGRSAVGQGMTTALHESVTRWLEAEQQRDDSGGVLSEPDEAALARLGDFLAPYDLVSASLDGIREQLLGMPYVGVLERSDAGSTDERPPVANDLPTPLFGGTLHLRRLRLVDAFGRTQAVPVDAVATTRALEVENEPAATWMRPRVQHLARWLWRLVDPAHGRDADPAAAPEAFVDQLDPTSMVNPVIGFLLPDHIDEALELFGVDGTPIGQIGHDPITGSVRWEPSPGRAVPPDAGPLVGLDPHETLLGELAVGVVRSDVAARHRETPPSASALTALLRAIDTTLWSVDTFAALGSPTIAGLVGRPIAVVRATMRLETPDDVDEVEVRHPKGPEGRRAAFATLLETAFPVRLGALWRADDALLGYFVDDDYTSFHLVDKVVAATARESGRQRGHLGLLGATKVPASDVLSHPYVADTSTLWLRPGQTRRLTLLMLPAGKAHLISGVTPMKSIALAEDWVGRGLTRLVPSIRVGPVLVDPTEIRLPLVSTLAERQAFTRRTGALTWRDDPILAATQTAYLPRLAHEAQEGWIRVMPDEVTQP